MSQTLSLAKRHGLHRLAVGGFYAPLAVLVGLVMPIVSALIYPTYTHQMHPSWLELSRLMELPFVICELLVIHIALRRGFNDAAVWGRLPVDIRIALGLLGFSMVVSSVLISRQPATSIMMSLITLVHLRFAGAVFTLAQREKRRSVTSFVPILGLGLITLAALTAWRFAFPPPVELVPGGVIEWPSALPGFISVRHFGSWTGAVSAGLLVLLLYGEPDRPRLIASLYMLAICLTIWSGTRAAVLATVVVVTVSAITLRRLPSLGSVGSAIALTAAAFAVVLLFLPIRDPAFLLYVADDTQSANMISGGRLALWAATLARWWQSPLFGWGTGSTFWEVYVGWTHTQPHNVVLQFLISWGIFGAAGGLWLLGRAIAAVHARGIGEAALRPLTAVLYALLFQSLLEGMLHYPRFIMLIIIGFALILAHDDRPAGEPLAH